MSRLAIATCRVAARMIRTSPSNDMNLAPARTSDLVATFFRGLPYFQTYSAIPPAVRARMTTSTPRYTARFWITHHSRSKWLALLVAIVFGKCEGDCPTANEAKHRLTYGRE